MEKNYTCLIANHCPGTTLLPELPGGASCKEPSVSVGGLRDMSSIPGLGRSLKGGHGKNPLQYSYLENPTDRGAWQSYSPWGHKESDKD